MAIEDKNLFVICAAIGINVAVLGVGGIVWAYKYNNYVTTKTASAAPSNPAPVSS